MTFLPRLANIDYSPGFSAGFDSTIIPPPPPDNDPPAPLTRTNSVNIPHPPSIQDTRRIRSMQPPLSVSSSMQDPDLEDSGQTGYDGGLQDSPVVPALRIPQTVEEVHIVPLPEAEEDDKRPSTSHHAYDKSDLWPWTKRNTAILADVVHEPPQLSVSPPVDDKVDPAVAAEIGPSSSTWTNVTTGGPEHEQTLGLSYLPEMTTPSSRSFNCDGTENTDPPVSIIASGDSEEPNHGHEGHDELESGGAEGECEGQVPPSPAPSEVPEIPVFPPAKKSNLSLDRHGSIGSLVARKSALFKSHSSNNSHDRRSSMPLPSAVIASLLPWRGSRRPSSEPELPSQSSSAKPRLSSSLPSPH